MLPRRTSRRLWRTYDALVAVGPRSARAPTRLHACPGRLDLRRVNALVRSGEWTAVRRRVYVETARLSVERAGRHAVEVAAAALATKQDVVGSHESAALIHRLTTFTRYDGAPVLTRPRDPRQDQPDPASPAPLVSHVPRHHWTEVSAAPVTTIARTAVDLARRGPTFSAVVVLDSALRRDVPRAELEEVLRVAKGWPGSRRATELVAFGNGRAESALESIGRWRMWQSGFPEPELQVPLFDEHGLMGYPDFLWDDVRVIGEADGLLKYRTEDDPDAPPDLRAFARARLRRHAA